jgi:hypothetical protein
LLWREVVCGKPSGQIRAGALVGATELKPDLVIKPMISLDRARRDL